MSIWPRIAIVEADITTLDVDAIVKAGGAIHRKAGKRSCSPRSRPSRTTR
jgi:hypothetical protein